MNVTKKNGVAQGALILLIGGVICKLIGAFYRIPLSNILGAEGIGVYQLIFPIYSLFLVFASGGIPIALSKIVAECRARQETKRCKRFLWQAFILLFVVSLIFSAIFIIFGTKIAVFQGNEQAGFGYIAVAIATVFASILTAFRGYFQGYENMTPTAVSQIVEQISKLILGLVFASVFVEYGISYGVFGAMLGVALGEVGAMGYLLINYGIKRKKVDILEPETRTSWVADFKYLIKKSLPITLNAIILPLILAIDSVLIVNLLLKTGLNSISSTQMFGVYSGMVNSLINLPTVFSLALAVALIPSISYGREKGEDISKIIVSTLKIILVVAIPCIFIYMAFSREIIAVLYPSATQGSLFETGALLLRISAINIFYISLLQVTTAILQATNKSFFSFLNLLFAGIIKVILTVFLVVSPLSIYGASIASIMCFALASGLNLIVLGNEFKISLQARKLLYIFGASAFVLGVAIVFNLLFNLIFSGFVSIIFSLFIAGFTYFVLLLLLPVFENDEIIKIPLGEKILVIRQKFYSKFRKQNTGL